MSVCEDMGGGYTRVQEAWEFLAESNEDCGSLTFVPCVCVRKIPVLSKANFVRSHDLGFA